MVFQLLVDEEVAPSVGLLGGDDVLPVLHFSDFVVLSRLAWLGVDRPVVAYLITVSIAIPAVLLPATATGVILSAPVGLAILLRLLFFSGWTLVFELLAALAHVLDELVPGLVVSPRVAQFSLLERLLRFFELAFKLAAVSKALVVIALLGVCLAPAALQRLLGVVLVALVGPPLLVLRVSLLERPALVIAIGPSVVLVTLAVIATVARVIVLVRPAIVIVLTPTEILLVLAAPISPRFLFVPGALAVRPTLWRRPLPIMMLEVVAILTMVTLLVIVTVTVLTLVVVETWVVIAVVLVILGIVVCSALEVSFVMMPVLVVG